MRVAHRQVAAAFLLLVGCATEPEVAPAPGVVATVGEERILADDLRIHASRVPITLLSSSRPDSARRQYLKGLIVRRLLARELTDRGLDTAKVVTQQAEDMLRNRLSDLYRREHLWPEVTVERAQVQAFYDSLGLAVQRLVSGIVARTRAEAEQMRRGLLAGESFEKMAKRQSKHPLSAAAGGELGHVTVRQAATLGISAETFADLPDSAISEVFSLGDQFQIIRFLDTRHPPLEEFGQQILYVVMERARERYEAERLNELTAELGWRSVPEGLAIIDQRGGGNTAVQPWLFGSVEMASPLFVYADTAISIGQMLDISKRRRRDITDAASAERLGQSLRAEYLFAEASRRLGMESTPEMISWQENLIEELGITELRRLVLAEAPTLTSDDVQQFYKDYSDLFRESDDILIVEALLETEEDAAAVLADAEAGQDLMVLARERTTRTEGPADSRGTLRLNEHERMTNSVLYAAVQEAPLNEIVGPVAVQGGFSVFRVIHREKGTMIPFLDVEQRARAYARRTQQSETFEDFVDELLDRYEDQTRIYESELALALPDSLVDEIARRDRQRAGLPVDLN